MHCSDSPLFKEARGGVNFNTSEVRKSKKLKKWGGSMVQGQVSVKVRGRGGGGHFCYVIFARFIISSF